MAGSVISTLARSAVKALSDKATQPHRPQGPFRADIAIRDGAKAAAKMADRWMFDRTGARVRIDAPDMDALYNHLIRLCYLPPLAEKTLPVSLMLHNVIGWLGRGVERREVGRSVSRPVRR